MAGTKASTVFAALTLLCFQAAAATRKLQVAPICQSGYNIDGSCFSNAGVYLADEGITLEFASDYGWTKRYIAKALQDIFYDKLFKFNPTDCIDFFIKQNMDSDDECACSVACAAAEEAVNAPTAGFGQEVIQFFAGQACESICSKLYDKAYEIAEKAVNDYLDSSSGSSDSGGGACFPSGSTVLMADGSRRAIEQVKVGEKVLTIVDKRIIPSVVYGFAHRLENEHHRYVNIETAAGRVVSASRDHYVYISKNKMGSWKTREVIPAGKIKIGDSVWVLDANNHNLVLSNVTSVSIDMKRGLINPFTLSGTILVDGVAASVYNDLMGSEERMHRFTAFIRWLYKLAPGPMNAVHAQNFDKYCSEILIALLKVSKQHNVLGSLANRIVYVISRFISEPLIA